MLTVTLLPPAVPSASPTTCTYCSHSSSPPLPRKKKTRCAGLRISTARAHAQNSLPSAPPPLHPVSPPSVDTPTPSSAPPGHPSPVPLDSKPPFTKTPIHLDVAKLSAWIEDLVERRVGPMLSVVKEELRYTGIRIGCEVKCLEQVIVTGDSQLLRVTHYLDFDEEYQNDWPCDDWGQS
ncbi:hypothetical protein EDB19DRAFT_1914417 [Suillus lakei]|nr:hypothetical protein EDB19DRAFT_1914417 [Suillus lakei]